VVGGVALGRQRPALDRVREDDGRTVGLGVRLAVGGEERLWVVTSQVAQAGEQLVVGQAAEQPPQRGVAGREPLAQLGGVRAQQPLELLVAHAVDPRAQRLAAVAREQLAQPRAVLHGRDVPARGLEHPREPPRGDVGHHPVERLAVEVDDPHDLAEVGDHRVDDRLPARALVELGVADQRDLAPADRRVEVSGDVAVRERAPDRRGGPESDRPGRVVHGVRVLHTGRVGLQAAVLAQRLEPRSVEPAEQEVDRVQHG
jgi:hypothetical protein